MKAAANAFTDPDATIADRVRAAMPEAREFLLEGLEGVEGLEGTLVDRLGELLGYYPCQTTAAADPDDDAVGQELAAFAAAFALGIATGLLLRPEAFEKGGRP